ncbi:WD-40 repeat-containing protein MSI5-like isoform X8 [Apium graveolens]|uniref:WD-40 repeat-containing protein MSI5-like isoform X8 n=1 Tax=Apium graveolens TaxID=4045 RepID=UPI003D7B3DBE
MIPALYCGIGRSGFTPTVKVEKAHDADLHCVDWNPHDVNFILTGSADNSVGIFDRRNFTSGPVHIFPGHSEAVLCVQWSPDRASVFGSSAEDGVLNIWDHKLLLDHHSLRVGHGKGVIYYGGYQLSIP